MGSILKRAAVISGVCLALGACDYGLMLPTVPSLPGATVQASNDGHKGCDTSEADPQAGPGVPVDVTVFSTFGLQDLVVQSVTTDEHGEFVASLTAPDRPGQHVVLAFCGGLGDVEEILNQYTDDLMTMSLGRSGGLRATAVDGPADPDGLLLDVLEVAQVPMSMSVDQTEVAPGTQVEATFSWCKAQNDFDFLLGSESYDGSPLVGLPYDLVHDYPDLTVYVDGEAVTTVTAPRRYPDGTVTVPLTLDDPGAHEITGVCTYQTFDWNEGWITEFNEERKRLYEEAAEALTNPTIDPNAQDGRLHTSDVDYPVRDERFTYDEATLEVSATVTVLGGATEPAGVPVGPGAPASPRPSGTGVDGQQTAAVPVVAAPRYAG